MNPEQKPTSLTSLPHNMPQSVPPDEMLTYVLADLRSYIGIVGAWAEVLSGEIYQELRPQAIESLQICAKNMQLSYDELRLYLIERKKYQTGVDRDPLS